MRKQPDTLKYGLEDVVPRQELPLYTLQHIVYFAAGIIVLPIDVYKRQVYAADYDCFSFCGADRIRRISQSFDFYGKEAAG